MVQTFNLTPTPSSASMIGSALGQGMAKNFVPPEQMVQRNLLKQALAESKATMNDPNAQPIDALFSMLQAGAGIPGSERYMGALIPEVLKLSQAKASQKPPFGMEGQGRTPEERQQFINEMQAYQQQGQQQLPQFGQTQPNQANQFFPSVQGGNEAPGNFPQAATSGLKNPVLSNSQLMSNAKPLAKEMTEAGIPTTVPQAYEILKSQNEDIKESNKLVELERKERVGEQKTYGSLGETALQKVMPDASPEQVAYFKRKGEDFAGQSKSEADIERSLASEARIFKNMISKIKDTIPPGRSYNRAYQSIMGTSRDKEKREADARIKVQPLLEEGLYDTARNLLSEVGYYPEEREGIVSSLGENTIKSINEMPRIWDKKDIGSFERQARKFQPNPRPNYTPEKQEIFTQNLGQTLQNDPATNLILLRRKYEDDKGVDWQLYKDSLNELINTGQFKPNSDQFNQLDSLEQPPLDLLDKILYGIGIGGR